MTRTLTQLVNKLRAGTTEIESAIARAQKMHPNSVIKMAVAAEHSDKSGRIIVRFDGTEYVADVVQLLNFLEANK